MADNLLNAKNAGGGISSGGGKRLCIKVKFFAQTTRLYGIAVILVGEDDSYIEEAMLNLSTFSVSYNQIHRESSFEDFYKITADAKETLHSHQKNYFRIKNAIEKEFALRDKMSKRRGKSKDISEVEEDIKEIIRRSISDKKIVIFAAFEEITNEALAKMQIERQKKQDEEIQKRVEADQAEQEEEIIEDFFAVDEGVNLVDCAPVVSPVGGVPIVDLKEDDRILVIYGIRNEVFDKKNPNPKDISGPQKRDIRECSVVRSGVEDGLFKVLVMFDEKLYGKIEEAESVKIKTIFQAKPKVVEKKKRPSKILLILLATLVTILLGAVVVLVFVL